MSAPPSLRTSLPAPTSRLTALPTYVFAWLDELKHAARARGAELIDLSIGNPDRPTPAPIIDAITAAFHDKATHGYPPFNGTPRFLQAAADYMRTRFNVEANPETEVLCLSGTKEGLAHLTMAYADDETISLVPSIYYPVHGRATGLVGSTPHWLPLAPETGFLPSFDDIPAHVLRRARLLFLNYPSNPTGAVATREFLESAVEFCRRHSIVLVSDAAYAEITFDGRVAPSVLEIPGAREVAIEFYSFSKSFCMAGSRVGFAVGNPEIIAALHALRSNMGYGTPMAIQAGAAFALDHAAELIPPIVAGYKERRDVLAEGFRSLGWNVPTPKASMYLWLPVPPGFSSQSWTEHLIDHADVVVTPGDAFGHGGAGFFRTSLVQPPDVLRAMIERLRKAGITATRRAR